MITRTVKLQLVVFAVITLLGVSYVGARYARLDSLIHDTRYHVTAHFAESGGVFVGAEVSYRGVAVGRVSDMRLTDSGVDVVLAIDKGSVPVPEQSRALVGNRSAVGEQYVELQPLSSSGPYLKEGSQIPVDRTAVPITSTQWLLGTDRLVNSVNKQSLSTVVDAMGTAFAGAGDDLGRLIDSSDAFLKTADQNFDVTTALLKDGNKVLQTQLDSASAIRGFSRDLGLVSDTLAASDGDLRRVIANGSATATELRTFLEENQVDLGQLINNLVTTGDIVVKHIKGIREILVVYPYVVASAYIVVDHSENGMLDAHFGLIMTDSPQDCHKGYEKTDRRAPQQTGNRPMPTNVGCKEPQSQSNARGSQWAPRVSPEPVATYNSTTGKLTYADQTPGGTPFTGTPVHGTDSWTWLLVGPLVRAGADS